MARGNDMGIKELSKGVYQVRPYIGRDPLTGKYVRAKAQTVRGTKAEARAVRDSMLERARGGLVVDAARLTFGEIAEGWYSSIVVSERRPNTLRYYRRMADVAVKLLGPVRIADITPDTVTRTLAAIKAEHRYSGTSMKHAYKTISAILAYAEDNDYIRKNPCRKVKAPEVSTEEASFLCESEAARLRTCLDASARKQMATYEEKETRADSVGGRSYLRGFGAMGRLMAVRIALATGLRRGEVGALTWGRVDFDNNRIRVAASLTSDSIPGPTKSKMSRRIVPVDNATMETLMRWRDFQAGELLKLGLVQDGDTPVCTSEVGGWMDLRRFERWWREWRAENGFPELRFHDLRHTYATMLLTHGVPVNVVSRLLGHSSVKTTLDIYAHVLEGVDEAAAEIMGGILLDCSPETSDFGRNNHFLTTYSQKGTVKRTGQPIKNVG